jgi:hypothetical protein
MGEVLDLTALVDSAAWADRFRRCGVTGRLPSQQYLTFADRAAAPVGFGRLARYREANGAERLAHDPGLRARRNESDRRAGPRSQTGASRRRG